MVWLVYFKCIIGWHTIHPDIFNEINAQPIYGIYNDYNKGLIEAIKYNLNNCCDVDSKLFEEYKNNIDNINNIDKLKILHKKIIKSLNPAKYTYKYCDIKEFDIIN